MALTLEDLRRRRAEIEELGRAHGAGHFRVFGSVARGEADDHSDLDLIIDMEPDRPARDLLSLIVELEDALGCRVHLVEATPDDLDPVYRHAVAEAVPL